MPDSLKDRINKLNLKEVTGVLGVQQHLVIMIEMYRELLNLQTAELIEAQAETERLMQDQGLHSNASLLLGNAYKRGMYEGNIMMTEYALKSLEELEVTLKNRLEFEAHMLEVMQSDEKGVVKFND